MNLFRRNNPMPRMLIYAVSFAAAGGVTMSAVSASVATICGCIHILVRLIKTSASSVSIELQVGDFLGPLLILFIALFSAVALLTQSVKVTCTLLVTQLTGVWVYTLLACGRMLRFSSKKTPFVLYNFDYTNFAAMNEQNDRNVVLLHWLDAIVCVSIYLLVHDTLPDTLSTLR